MDGQTELDWRVLPHGPLETLGDGLWRVQGDMPGNPLKRVMTLARMRDGRLVVHSAMALDALAMAELEKLGEPACLVVPGPYHRMDAARFVRRYPKMRVICPPGARRRVERAVRVDETYPDFRGDDRVSLEPLAGVGQLEGVMRVQSDDGTTLVFNDLLFNMPHPPGLPGVMVRLMGSSGGPRVTRVARLLMVKDARAFAEALVALATTANLARLVVAHHEMVVQEPADTLRAVARTL